MAPMASDGQVWLLDNKKRAGISPTLNRKVININYEQIKFLRLLILLASSNK